MRGKTDTPLLAIMSAEVAGLSPAINAENTEKLRLELYRLGFVHVEAEGVYKGTTERSFVIRYFDDSQFRQLAELAEQFNQESVLVVAPDNASYIVGTTSLTKGVEGIGFMRELPIHLVTPGHPYTKVNGRVYVAG